MQLTSQLRAIAKHQVVYFKYIKFLFVNYTSIKLGGGGGESNGIFMIIMHCQLTSFLFTTLPDQSGRDCHSPRWPHEGDSKKVCLLGVGCPLWPGSPVRMRASTEDLPQVGRQEASLRRWHSGKDLKEVGARSTQITWRSFPRQREP